MDFFHLRKRYVLFSDFLPGIKEVHQVPVLFVTVGATEKVLLDPLLVSRMWHKRLLNVAGVCRRHVIQRHGSNLWRRHTSPRDPPFSWWENNNCCPNFVIQQTQHEIWPILFFVVTEDTFVQPKLRKTATISLPVHRQRRRWWVVSSGDSGISFEGNRFKHLNGGFRNDGVYSWWLMIGAVMFRCVSPRSKGAPLDSVGLTKDEQMDFFTAAARRQFLVAASCSYTFFFRPWDWNFQSHKKRTVDRETCDF